MKYIGVLLVFLSFSLYGQHIESKKIDSKVLGQSRNLWIYTPWQYEEFPEKKREVIYVFDAQAREYFDVVHSTIQFFGGEEYAFIVVGVESPFIKEKKQSRNTDFLPKPVNEETIKKYGEFVGGADRFIGFLKEELIPFIDKNYRTLPQRVAIGHSNGGTFICYSLLKESNLFNSFIAISPNLAYDDGQVVNRFMKFNPDDLKLQKFLFISSANENEETSTRWKGWNESNEKVIAKLKNKKFNSKIYLVTKDFSATEDHNTTFPIGTFYGLKSFINYQFRTGKNIISYYDRLASQNFIKLDEGMVNNLAYECFWNDKPKEALIVIDWAIDKFPDAHNLYDSQGEFYEVLGELENAKISYQNAVDVLSKTKSTMKTETDQSAYDAKLEYYMSNFLRVSK